MNALFCRKNEIQDVSKGAFEKWIFVRSDAEARTIFEAQASSWSLCASRTCKLSWFKRLEIIFLHPHSTLFLGSLQNEKNPPENQKTKKTIIRYTARNWNPHVVQERFVMLSQKVKDDLKLDDSNATKLIALIKNHDSRMESKKSAEKSCHQQL